MVGFLYIDKWEYLSIIFIVEICKKGGNSDMSKIASAIIGSCLFFSGTSLLGTLIVTANLRYSINRSIYSTFEFFEVLNSYELSLWFYIAIALMFAGIFMFIFTAFIGEDYNKDKINDNKTNRDFYIE